MSVRQLGCALVLAALLAAPAMASARQGCCDPCEGYTVHCDSPCETAAPSAPQYVEKTIYVPEWSTQTRTVTCTKYKHETREKTVTVRKCVPETKQVTREYTVMVPETRSKTVKYTVRKPVWETKTKEYTVQVPEWSEVEKQYTVHVPVYKNVEKTYTVMVPHREKRTGTRNVCKCVPVEETRTVTCDEGHWETRVEQVACNSCCDSCCDPCGESRTVCRKVWVPNVVTKEVPVTVYKRVWEKQSYDYHVTVCKPETRTCMVRVCEYKPETRTRKVKVCNYKTETRTRQYKVCKYVREERERECKYTVCVPQTRSRTCNVTTYKTVAEERNVTYRVCVPYQEQKEIQVRVCKMVPKVVMVPADDCGSCCKQRCRRKRRRGCC